MDKIIDKLCKLYFSKLEAQIYVTLIRDGEMSGYQIAKKINISRSSVYSALEPMYEKGIVLSRMEGAQIYSAQSPETLFERLRKEYINTSKEVEEELMKHYKQDFEEKFTNLKGFETVISNAKQVIKSSKKEICINTDIDIQTFKKEINSATEKGVRVILFSFIHQNCDGLNIESYLNEQDECSEPTRIMMVSDCKLTLVADTYKARGTWLGTLTNNTLFTSIVTEHILHDIYDVRGRKIENNGFRLNSMIELR